STWSHPYAAPHRGRAIDRLRARHRERPDQGPRRTALMHERRWRRLVLHVRIAVAENRRLSGSDAFASADTEKPATGAGCSRKAPRPEIAEARSWLKVIPEIGAGEVLQISRLLPAR